MSADDQSVNRAQKILTAEPPLEANPHQSRAASSHLARSPTSCLETKTWGDRRVRPPPAPPVDRATPCEWMLAPPRLVHDGELNHDTLMVSSMSWSPSDVQRVDRAGAPDLLVRTNDMWKDSGCLPSPAPPPSTC